MSGLADFILMRVAEDEKAADIDEQIGHVSRDGYARAVRECMAIRSIVARHPLSPHPVRSRVNCGSCGAQMGPACLTLRDLAEVWSDHPDYREEWRP